MKAWHCRPWWKPAGGCGPRTFVLAVIVLAAAGLSRAQTLTGTVFEDRDGDGIIDVGEPLLAGVMVDLSGTQAGGASFAQTIVTGTDGLFSFSPGQGAYLIAPVDPPGWRLSVTRPTFSTRSPPPATFFRSAGPASRNSTRESPTCPTAPTG